MLSRIDHKSTCLEMEHARRSRHDLSARASAGGRSSLTSTDQGSSRPTPSSRRSVEELHAASGRSAGIHAGRELSMSERSERVISGMNRQSNMLRSCS